MEQTYQSTNYGGNAPQNYQNFFVRDIGGPMAKDLIATANLQSGERVLDVGCGTGVVARMAAERVGKSGRVVGLDFNPGMIQVAKAVTPKDLGIEWLQADAEAMPVDDGSFDVATCQLTLQFIANKLAALRETHRALAEGGRVHALVPGPKPRLFGFMGDAIGRHIGPEGVAFLDLVFSMHDEGELRDLFGSVGFRDIKVDKQMKPMKVAPPREFLWQYIHSTPLAQSAAEIDDDIRDRVEQEVCANWKEFERDGKLQFEVGVTIVSATR